MKFTVNFFLILFMLISLRGYAAGPADYEIVGAGSGMQGTYLVKVYVLSKKSKPNPDLLKKCAVHGVLFRGFSNQESRVSQKPLAGSMLAEQEHSDFFEPFFKDGGAYTNYVDIVTTQYEIVKTAKKQYRIGATFAVSKDQLRKDLEKAGIIKGLSTGF